MIAVKTIKFDLPIDGVKVRTVEELRDHFNTEILDIHKNGLLIKWLKSQREHDLYEKVVNIPIQAEDQDRLNQLCYVFSIELDAEIINELVKAHHVTTYEKGAHIDPLQLEYKQFHDKYEIFMTAFKKYERFDEYCKDLNNSQTIASGNAELIKMAHFIETGEKIHVIEYNYQFSGNQLSDRSLSADSHYRLSRFSDGNDFLESLEKLSIKKSDLAHAIGNDFSKSYYFIVGRQPQLSYPNLHDLFKKYKSSENYYRPSFSFPYDNFSGDDAWGFYSPDEKDNANASKVDSWSEKVFDSFGKKFG